MKRNHSLWDTLAAALDVDKVTVLATDEDIRAAEREQWDDGTNYLAVAPGVVIGYERNVRHQHDAAPARHRGRYRGRQRARPRPRRSALHDMPYRTRPRLTAMQGRREADHLRMTSHY